MEENIDEFYDYLGVIWKRKILIIAVTLIVIGVAAGRGVMNWMYKLEQPVINNATAVVKIGKRVRIVTGRLSGGVVDYIESPAILVNTFPLNYDYRIKENPGYHLHVEEIASTSMVRINLKGPDSGVERVLKELVDLLVEEHGRKVKSSEVAYKNFMANLKTDAEVLKKEMFVLNASIKEMKKKEGSYLLGLETSGEVIVGDKTGGDRSAFLNMLYLKTLDKEGELRSIRANLRSIQMQLTAQQITLGNAEEYKTEMVGRIKTFVVENKEKKETFKKDIIVAGFIGLAISLFIVFFMEYIEETKSKRKRKLQG